MWSEHYIPQVPASAPHQALVVGPVGRHGYFDCGMGLRRWWDGRQWIGPAIAPSSIPWKSSVIAYVLLLLWGGLGVHRFYLRSIVVGVVMLALWLVGSVFTLLGALMRAQEAAAAVTASLGGVAAPTLASAIPTPVLTAVGALLLAVLAVWLLFDLCTMPSLVHVINQKRAGQVIGVAVAVQSREEATLAR